MGIQSIIPKTKYQDTIVFQTSLFSNEDKLIMAPLQNLTSFFFRKTFEQFFPGNVDSAVAPFLSVSANAQNPNAIQYKDILPNLNRDLMPLVPQILGNNANDILDCAKIIERFGYREVNLNMGCPKKDIVSRRRGAGLLQDADNIKLIIETILNNTKLQLSLKVRLGIKDDTELHNLIPIFNMYPLKSICIHARSQQQQYDGQVDLKSFSSIAAELRHTIIYNGDIFTKEDFTKLKTQFPHIKHWMIGRGLLKNPFLCADIRGIHYNKKETLLPYLRALQNNFIESLPYYNETTILGKMKEFIKYLSSGYNFDSTQLLRESSLKSFNNSLYNILTSETIN